jgi:hypothetical protein
MDGSPGLIIINQKELYWKYIFIIFVIILIIIIILISVWWWWSSNPPLKSLHEDCVFDENCHDGLVCFHGKCKVPLGEICERLDECVSEATACYNGICVKKKLSPVGGFPPCEKGLMSDDGTCKVPIGGKCHKLSDCVHTAGSCEESVCTEKKRGYDSHCSHKDSCDDGFTCSHGRCKISTDSFVPCVEDSQCASDGICRSAVCKTHHSSESSDTTGSTGSSIISPGVITSSSPPSTSAYLTAKQPRRSEGGGKISKTETVPQTEQVGTPSDKKSSLLSKYVSASVDSIYKDIVSKF